MHFELLVPLSISLALSISLSEARTAGVCREANGTHILNTIDKMNGEPILIEDTALEEI